MRPLTASGAIRLAVAAAVAASSGASFAPRGSLPGGFALEAPAWAADPKPAVADAGPPPAPSSQDAGALPPPPPPPPPLLGGSPPDPQPLRTRHQWIVTLAYRDGEASFRGARPIELPQAGSTARNVGRF